MNGPNFHADRLTGLGSSDAAAACGVSRFKTVADVYHEKRGELGPIEDNEPMLFGRLLQPVVLGEFARRTGAIDVIAEPAMMRSERWPHMIAHLDASATVGGVPAVIEAKTARSPDGWGEHGSADIPTDYVVQTHHQMLVCNVTLAFVPVLIAGSDFRIYEVPFDRELGDMIVEREADLWSRIQRAEPPAIDFDTPGALDLVRRLYRGTNGEKINATAAEEAWRAVYFEALAKRDKYGTAVDCAKAHLLYEMGDAAELAFADGTTFRRKLVSVKGYTVEAREQIDARFIKPKETNA